jgi:flagellar biosynthesis/type III secretory pathway protein FliH
MTRIIRARPPDDPLRRTPRPQGTRVLRAGQIDALCEAERRLAQARLEAAEIVNRARDESDALRARAAEEGRAEAAALLLEARRRGRELQQAAEDELTHLATRIAGRLLGEQLRLDPAAVARIVEGCLRGTGAFRRGRLRVHPADVAVIETALPRLRALCAAEILEIEGDGAIERGGCLLETEAGEVDGRISTQLRAVEEALTR